MALTPYLAMTAAEMQNCRCLPEKIAWMACHFSAYTNGISNVPVQLPSGSVLILNDRIPPLGHVPVLVADQLAQAAEQLGVSRVLLDFQRPGDPLTADIAAAIIGVLPCPVALTPEYAQSLDCPVFFCPKLRKPLQEQLAPWQEREIWLEAALDCEIIEVTEQGSHILPGISPESAPHCHTDPHLHCRYFLELEDHCIRFTVWRDQEKLQALLEEADALGVTCAIGLYQQLHEKAVEDQ